MYSRVKNVIQRVSAKEEIADNPHAFPVGLICPEPPQVGDSVDATFFLPHHGDEIAEGYPLRSQ
jgi:hypothetical protein